MSYSKGKEGVPSNIPGKVCKIGEFWSKGKRRGITGGGGSNSIADVHPTL